MQFDANLERLQATADALGPLMQELCLVGGTAANLLITDPGASPLRATLDVDLIVEATQYSAYHVFCQRLAVLGFHQSTDDEPICRWRRGELVVDIMPLDESILGFSNHWYKSAFRSKCEAALSRNTNIFHVDAPHFLATKLAAFDGRGKGDYVMSHDLEDMIRVIDGRSEIEAELAASRVALQDFVSGRLQDVIKDRMFMEAFPGYFEDGAERAALTLKRLKSICQLRN